MDPGHTPVSGCNLITALSSHPFLQARAQEYLIIELFLRGYWDQITMLFTTSHQRTARPSQLIKRMELEATGKTKGVDDQRTSTIIFSFKETKYSL